MTRPLLLVLLVRYTDHVWCCSDKSCYYYHLILLSSSSTTTILVLFQQRWCVLDKVATKKKWRWVDSKLAELIANLLSILLLLLLLWRIWPSLSCCLFFLVFFYSSFFTPSLRCCFQQTENRFFPSINGGEFLLASKLAFTLLQAHTLGLLSMSLLMPLSSFFLLPSLFGTAPFHW